MESLYRAFDLQQGIRGEYVRLDIVSFQSMLGLMVDDWCAVNGGDSVAMMEALLEACKQVNAELGPMEVDI